MSLKPRPPKEVCEVQDIEVDPDKDVDEEGTVGPTPSCVQRPTQFSFAVDSGEFRKR